MTINKEKLGMIWELFSRIAILILVLLGASGIRTQETILFILFLMLVEMQTEGRRPTTIIIEREKKS